MHSIEYRVNGGAWNPYTAPVAFNAPGNYNVDYRATDKVQNTSARQDAQLPHPLGRGLHGAALGRVRRHDARLAVARVTPATAARRPRARWRRRSPAACCTCRRTTSSSTPTRRRRSLGPVNFLGQDLPSLGNNWSGGDAVHGAVHRRLAERGPGRVAGGQQLLPLHDHPQPQRRLDLHRAVQGQPEQHRGRARPGAGQHQPRCRTTRSRSRSGCGTRASRPADTVRRSTAIIAPASVATRRLGELRGDQRPWTSTGGLSLQPRTTAAP